MNHTPIRTIRVSDELWRAAKTTAAEQSTTVSAVIVAFLAEYTSAETRNGDDQARV